MNITEKHFSPSTLILISLLQSSKHGYAIKQDIAQTFNKNIGYGTLYGAIKRLEEQGLIKACNTHDRRQPYQLTSKGLKTIKSEIRSFITVTLEGYKRLKAFK